MKHLNILFAMDAPLMSCQVTLCWLVVSTAIKSHEIFKYHTCHGCTANELSSHTVLAGSESFAVDSWGKRQGSHHGQ